VSILQAGDEDRARVRGTHGDCSDAVGVEPVMRVGEEPGRGRGKTPAGWNRFP
jgi:hypothetical protein